MKEPIKTNYDLKVSTLLGWVEQLSKPKIVTVIGKNRNTKTTINTKVNA